MEKVEGRMMDYLYKLRGAVSTAVDTVNKTMPGNPVWRDYDVGDQVASAGPALSWKVYIGRKKTTKKAVSVWVFEKRDVERWPRLEKEAFVELLKQGVARLTRIRHPRVLIVEQPLEEARDCLAFCTEPVFSSLANVLGRVDNMAVVPSHLENFKLEDVEIRHGLYQLCESLSFLHNDARMLHRNVCPESIVVNSQGSWKLAGVDFLVQVPPPTSTTEHPSFPQLEWDSALMPCTQPALNYVAPEHFVGGRCDTAADVFSLGCLAFAVYNKGNPPCDHGNNMKTFQANAEKFKSLPNKLLANIPADFRDDLKMCLNFTPDLRPDAGQLSKIAFFDDLLVKTLCYFDALCQMDKVQKSQFFKGLPTVLVQFPKRPLLQKVLPALASEFGSAELIPFMLPSLFHIAEQASNAEYTEHVLPHLVPVFQMKQPYQIPLMLLQKMELLLSKTPDDDVRTHLLPLVYNALDSDAGQIQELCLGIVPSICKLVDRQSMKTTLLPILLRLATDGGTLSVKVNALLCIGKLLDKLEKWMVTDQILPALPKINTKEPGVLMAVLGIYKLAFQHPRIGIAKEQAAKSALPFLMTISVDASLNVAQFDAFMTLIRAMLDRVEQEHRQKLQQLSAMQEDQRTKNFNDVIKESTAKRAVSPDLQGLDGLSSSGTTPRGGSPVQNGKSTSKGPMTFEEKKRLAAEQESTLRLRQQSPLTPSAQKKSGMGNSNSSGGPVLQPQRSSAVSPPPPSAASFDSLTGFGGATKSAAASSANRGGGPKDLSSSLAGLQFGSPMPPALRPPPSSTANPVLPTSSTGGWTPMNTSMTSTGSSNWTSTMGGGPTSTMMTMPQSNSLADFGSFGPMTGSSANASRPSSGQPQQKSMDLTAFDSLVAFPAAAAPKPMAAATGTMGNKKSMNSMIQQPPPPANQSMNSVDDFFR